MSLKTEIDFYREKFYWAETAPIVSDPLQEIMADFMECWDEEIRAKRLLNTPDGTCQIFKALLVNFPEIKESCLGLKIQEYIASENSAVLGRILDKVIKLRMIKDV